MKNNELDQLQENCKQALALLPELTVGARGKLYVTDKDMVASHAHPMDLLDRLEDVRTLIASVHDVLRDEPRRKRGTEEA